MIKKYEWSGDKCPSLMDKKQDYINLTAKHFFMERLGFNNSLSSDLARKFADKNIHND